MGFSPGVDRTSWDVTNQQYEVGVIYPLVN